MMKVALTKSIKDEKGQALIIVLILMLLGGLIIAPLLQYMSTGIKVGKEVYENKMYEFYAADAGVEDALWYLQSTERLMQLDPTWKPDNTTWSRAYDLTDDINGKDVHVTITYIWLLEGLHDPSPNVNDQLTVMGYFSTDDNTKYIVDFITESGDVEVDQIGVWLPRGYGYVDNSVEINGVPIDQELDDYPPSMRDRMLEILDLVKNPDTTSPHRDGTALLWNFSGTEFIDLSDLIPPPSEEGVTPGEKFPPTVRLSFNFTYPPGVAEANVFFPWMSVESGIAWDIGVGFYHIESLGITSATENTTTEAYVSWGTPRLTAGEGGTSSSIQGDYITIGNSLMTECWNRYWDSVSKRWVIEPGPPCNYSCPYNCRGKYFDESSATVDSNAVPNDAEIRKAYLYWTAWWTTDGADTEATLAVNGTSVGTDGTVVADRYYVLPTPGSNGYQYACFADVTDEVKVITTDVNDTEFTVGEVDAVPADTSSSTLWRQATNAGWSMIIIYSSAEKDPHQIYLYDQLAYLWDYYGSTAEFTILGFEAPLEGDSDAKLAIFAAEGDDWIDPDYVRFKGQEEADYCYLGDSGSGAPNPWDNVFNGYSTATGFTPSPLDGQPSGEISGVDIDIYTQDRYGNPLSEYVGPGDTSAKIRVETIGYGWGCDGIMLTYVVFSVRSTLVLAGEEFEVGTMTYEIK